MTRPFEPEGSDQTAIVRSRVGQSATREAFDRMTAINLQASISLSNSRTIFLEMREVPFVEDDAKKTAFVWNGFDLFGESHSLPGVALELLSNPRVHETFELFINAVDVGPSGMRLECQYNSDLFDAATVRRWLAAFEVLLRGAVADPTRTLGRLPIISDTERRAMVLWNRTEADYQAWRDQRDFTARKYAAWDRGERFA